MNLTPYQQAVRSMAYEVENINRLLATNDVSKRKAEDMLWQAANEVRRHAASDVIIKYGINAGKAWASVR